LLGDRAVKADRAYPLIGKGIAEFVEGVIGRPCSFHEIAGDASTRRFYRVASGRKTAVLAIHPEPLHPASPLYSNHRVLRSIGVPVPRILGASDTLGAVLMEDFGDVSLQKHLLGRGAGPAARRSSRTKPRPDARRLYRQACDLIVLFQEKGARALLPGDFASGNALDRDRLLFELDHFHRYFIRGLRGQSPSEPEEALLRAFYDDLAETCDRMPRVYCHRDFQSRNLIVRRGRLHLIDFQDARMGPYTYDTASLLRDSSLDLDEGLVQEMIEHLIGRLRLEPEEFRRDFDLMALQRNVKDLGTFGYMATVRGRRSYLEYVPRTIRSIRATLIRERRFHFVYPALDRHILTYEA
jgi:aminoglycoside/choline kinase family phosphotransferase